MYSPRPLRGGGRGCRLDSVGDTVGLLVSAKCVGWKAEEAGVAGWEGVLVLGCDERRRLF